MKGKTNRILVVVVKWRHHAGLLLNTLYLSGSSSASSSLSLVSDSVHTTSSSSSCWLTSNWLRARKSCIIRSTKNYKSNRLTFIVLLFLSLQTVHECDLSTGSCRKTQNYSPHNSAENCKGGSTKNRNETSYVIQLTTGGLLCTSRLFSGPDPGTNGAVWIRVPRGLGRTAVPSGGKIYNMRRYVINGDSSSSVFCFFFDFFYEMFMSQACCYNLQICRVWSTLAWSPLNHSYYLHIRPTLWVKRGRNRTQVSAVIYNTKKLTIFSYTIKLQYNHDFSNPRFFDRNSQ